MLVEEEYDNARYGEAVRVCEGVTRLLKVRAPIRIDIRRFRDRDRERFAGSRRCCLIHPNLLVVNHK